MIFLTYILPNPAIDTVDTYNAIASTDIFSCSFASQYLRNKLHAIFLFQRDPLHLTKLP